MNQRLLVETDASVRNYIEYPEVEIITSNCCGCPCCCKVAYFPIQKLTFIGHWRKSLLTPIVVGLFYCITMISFYLDTYNTFPETKDLIISYCLTTFLFFCFIFGYYCIIIKGPGYVPYIWLKTRQRSFTWEETIRGIAIYNDQVKSARSSPDKPKRSCFSKDARRYVLRADHFCRLGKSWIGLKNYRYFVLTCFYCFLFAIALTSSRYWLFSGIYKYYKDKGNKNSEKSLNLDSNKNYQNKLNINSINEASQHKAHNSNFEFTNTNKVHSNNENVKKDEPYYPKKFKFRIWYALGILTNLVVIFFGFSALISFSRSFYNLYRNVTIFELVTKKKVGRWDRGCIRNFEEVCGNKKYLPLWPFPFIYCIEPMESGFYDEIWDPNESSLASSSQNSRYHNMDSL